MAQLSLTINGHEYTLACDDGEEAHLIDLARSVEARIADVRREVKSAGQAQYLLMAGLMLADELELARERIQELEETIAGLKGEFLVTEPATATEDRLAGLLEQAARRMEDIAARLR
jgi:cell division protein ZapA